MVKTYKEFKKASEFFLGLSLWTWIQIVCLTSPLIYIAFSLRLNLGSPLLLFFAIVWMIIVSFVIKASLDDEVPGFYSSFLTHPFANHIFKNEEGYPSITKIHNLRTITENHLISKEGDLIGILKLINGISWNKTSKEDRALIIENWGNYLGQIQSIDSINSYLLNSSLLEDSLQCFIWVKPYKLQPRQEECLQQTNLTELSLVNQEWQQQIFAGNKFIASPEFYIIIRHKNNKTRNKFSYKLLTAILPESWIQALFKDDLIELEAEKLLLEQKIITCKSSLMQIGIEAKTLTASSLREFCNYWLNDQEELLLDKSKYLEYKSRLHKVYRLSVPPESGELDFWLLNYISLFKTESYISIYLQPRNAIQDRRRAENKSELLKQMKSKVSTINIIQENQDLARELIDKPFCFDLVIYIVIISDTVDKLQDVDNLMRKAFKQAKLASLDRQQLRNWLYSLPFAYNKLSKAERLFANLDFARSCFSFVDHDLGTPTGPLFASSLHNSKPVYLNEYDRAYCNNRGINFIGDSGSGKTVAAKLAIKRRLERGDSKFYVLDNTEDGWKFFVDCFAGEIIEIDKHGLENDEAKPLFNLFAAREKLNSDQYTKQIEDILKLLTLMNANQGTMMSNEKSFLISKIKELYSLHNRPSLSDFYLLLRPVAKQSFAETGRLKKIATATKLRVALLDNSLSCDKSLIDSELGAKWASVLAPYTKVCDGIYSKLMDGKESHLDNSKSLYLFTFAKLNQDSSFLPVSLFLLASFIENKVTRDKEPGITLVVDEAWKIFTGKHSEHGRELLIHLARAGRGLDLGLWTISQKPSDIPREIHSSASVSLCFQLKEARDRAEMAAYSNLNQNEQELLASPLIYESGNALFKTTRASGLVKLVLDPYEEVLCNSTRNFVNLRNQLFCRHLMSLPREEAALRAIKELRCLG